MGGFRNPPLTVLMFLHHLIIPDASQRKRCRAAVERENLQKCKILNPGVWRRGYLLPTDKDSDFFKNQDLIVCEPSPICRTCGGPDHFNTNLDSGNLRRVNAVDPYIEVGSIQDRVRSTSIPGSKIISNRRAASDIISVGAESKDTSI